MAAGCKIKALARNNTSFPTQAAARLRALFAEYVRLRAEPASSPEARAAAALKFYQFLARAVIANPEFGIGAAGNGRGILIYHTMGLGKTRLAVALAFALWDVRAPVVLLPKSLQGGFKATVEQFVALMDPELEGAALAAAQGAAVRRFRFVSSDAYNMAEQVARVTSGVEGSGSLNNRLLIVDEAHNLFRGIINSPSTTTNARRLYEMVMEARNLRIIFLTGTPASKDPFELVPCFNMLAGYDLLPTQYDVFYKHYVDRGGDGVLPRIKNRDKLANRLLGLVSHATHSLPGSPAEEGSGTPKPRELGGFPEEFPTIIERVEMAPEQYRQYLLAREKEEAEGKGGEGGRGPSVERIVVSPPLALPGSEAGGGSTYYVKSRSLGNFTPPRDERGRPVEEMPAAAFNAETSPKITKLLENLERSAGPALVYSQFVNAGGLGAVARFLEAAGFTRFIPEVPVGPIASSGPAAPAANAADADAADEPLAAVATAVSIAGEIVELGGPDPAAETFSPDGVRLYDVRALRDLMAGRPAVDVPVESLAALLETPRWGPGGSLSAAEVLAAPDAHPEESDRIDAADLDYPILLTGDGAAVADGMRRLAKAWKNKMPTIKALQVPDAILAKTLLGEDARREGDAAVGGGDAASGGSARRYAIISGDVKTAVRTLIQDAFNAPGNTHGEIIRVLLVSRTGAEGLDLKGIRQIHVLEPYWDKSREDQVKARGVRMGSHDHLPYEERDVQPFLYIADANARLLEGMRPTETDKNAPPARYRPIEDITIDERFHQRALGKNHLNGEFRTLLGEVSYECAINGYGNCRLCVPTDAPLFHEDPVRDLSLPDPCQALAEAEVEVKELTIEGTDGKANTYFYREDPEAAFGVRFFEFDADLGAHVPIDSASGLFMRLLEALG